MSIADALGWVLGLGTLGLVSAFLVWAVRTTKARQQAFAEALARRGWTVPPGEQAAVGQETAFARGVHAGRGFVATTRTTTGKNRRVTTRVRVPSSVPGRVVVSPHVPDSGFLGAALSLMLGGDLPPVWEGTPPALRGRWQVRGPAGPAAAVASPALVEALLRWDRNSGTPWIEITGGTAVLTFNGSLLDEATLVAMVELTAAAAGPAESLGAGGP